MLGSIVGDVIGSVYEVENKKSTEIDLFCRYSKFTDDTVMTIAVADAVMCVRNNSVTQSEKIKNREFYAYKYREYGRKYPSAGYGQMFSEWISASSLIKQNSYGNGAAMRVSPIGLAFDNYEDVIREAKCSVYYTHNHKDSVIAAQSIAAAVFYAKEEQSRDYIKARIQEMSRYDLSQKLDTIRPTYSFDSSCKGSVPQAIIAFLESDDFEDSIRKAISIGGDSDTIACITGGIAHAFYKKIPEHITNSVSLLLDSGLRQKMREFENQYKLTW